MDGGYIFKYNSLIVISKVFFNFNIINLKY